MRDTRRDFEVILHPLFIDAFGVKREDNFTGFIGLQKIENLIQRVGFIFPCAVYFVDDGLARRDINGAVADGIDLMITVHKQRNKVVFTGLNQIIKVRTRADDIGDVAFDVGWFPFLAN